MYWGIPPEVNAFRLTMAGAGPTAHVPQVTAFETAAITHTQQATQMAATAAATAASFVGAGGQVDVAVRGAAVDVDADRGCVRAEIGGHDRRAGTRRTGRRSQSTIPFPTVVANRVREATLAGDKHHWTEHSGDC